MSAVIPILIILLIAVVAFYICDRMGLPGDIGWVVKVIIGVICLIALLSQVGGFHFA